MLQLICIRIFHVVTEQQQAVKGIMTEYFKTRIITPDAKHFSDMIEHTL